MKYVSGYSNVNAGAYNIPVHTIYEYAEVVKERQAERQANDALTIQLAALQAKLSAVQAWAVDAWMPIETTLPSDNEPVLLTLENGAGHRGVIRAFYAHRFTESTGPLDDDAEYNGEKDEYFLEEGWYEQNQYEETHWFVGDKVIAWKYMPLPAPPAKRDECPNGCVDGVIVMTGNTTLDRPRSCPIHGPKSGEGAK